MIIHNHFTGGNIAVKAMDGCHIYLENELRDTMEDWFYWAFCVEGAQGKELTFHFQKHRLGYWGPAVSHDLVHWKWLDDCRDDTFTYHFGEDENKVYFAHNMLYHPDRFANYAKDMGWTLTELCKSRKGRSVPCLQLGEGSRSILLTARHHACESTGNYVLEGVLEELSKQLPSDIRIFCVPFVDYDGVVDGDQGKSRAPHDHNRDYIDSPLYPEVAAIQAYRQEKGIYLGFDFHSPWHKGGENDNIYIVRNMLEKDSTFDRFADLLEEEITEDSMAYHKEDDHPALTGWNQPSPNCAYTTNCRPECSLAFSLESAYFGTADNKVSQQRLIALGRCFARTMIRYIALENDNG